MDFKIDFNPEEIANKMSEAIVSSTFKEMFEKAVKAEIDRINTSGWSSNSVIQNVIQGFIRQTMEKVLHDEYSELVSNAIKQKLTGEKLEELVSAFVEKIRVRDY